MQYYLQNDCKMTGKLNKINRIHDLPDKEPLDRCVILDHRPTLAEAWASQSTKKCLSLEFHYEAIKILHAAWLCFENFWDAAAGDGQLGTAWSVTRFFGCQVEEAVQVPRISKIEGSTKIPFIPVTFLLRLCSIFPISIPKENCHNEDVQMKCIIFQTMG